MLELRERRQRAALIASLSPQARAAGTEFAREATDSFLVAVASELATVRKEIDEKVADVEADCKQKRATIRDLRQAIDSRDELLETQRRQMRDIETDLAAARTEISRLTTHLDVLRSEGVRTSIG
jgi:chromosome segregation ATPase